jgi:hypothetical protein
MLPVYVDHILYPRLTESSFVTEVFHINKDGKDAGVVYSEVQGCEDFEFKRIDAAYVLPPFLSSFCFPNYVNMTYSSLHFSDIDESSIHRETATEAIPVDSRKRYERLICKASKNTTQLTTSHTTFV